MRTSLNSSLEAELVETFLLWYSCFYSSANAIAVWGVSPYQCLRVPDANSHSFEVKLYHTSVYDQYSHLSWRKYQCLYRECWFQTLFVCVLVRNVWLLWRLQFSHSVPEVCGSRFCRIARTFQHMVYLVKMIYVRNRPSCSTNILLSLWSYLKPYSWEVSFPEASESQPAYCNG